MRVKNSFQQVGQNIKHDVSLLSGTLKNNATVQINNGINTLNTHYATAQNNLQNKSADISKGFFSTVSSGVSNFANKLSARVNK